MDAKRKVTLWLPVRVLGAFDEAAKRQLGIGRNAFFSLAALMLLAKLATLLVPKKRATLLKDLESEFETVIAEASKTA